MPLKFIKSTKGKKQLYYEGYLYNKKAVNKSNVTWRCIEYHTKLKCCAIIHTDSDMLFGNVIDGPPIHDHAADDSSMGAKIVLSKIKKRATICDDNPRVVIGNAFASIPTPIIARLPKMHAMSREIQRVRNVKVDAVDNKHSRIDFVLSAENETDKGRTLEMPATGGNDDDMPPLLEEESTSNSCLETCTNRAQANADTQSVASTKTSCVLKPADSSDSDSSGDDSLEEMETELGEITKCLFCDKISNAIEPAITHLRDEHKVDLAELKKKHRMDQYSYIKLINCIRTESLQVDKLLAADEAFWSDEKYLKPVEYESWLSFDFDHLKIPGDNCGMLDSRALVDQINQQALLLEMANDDITRMRQAFAKLISKEADDKGNASKPIQNDQEYFKSYSHFGIHHEMLSDVVRTTSYRDALLKNKDFIQGKTVLDVGCGTSVLSIFASRAGASQVVGIDNSEILYNAMSILKRNKIENISLIKGRLEDTELPIEKYDIIISEWMGYFLFFEGMLDSIIYARQRHLKEGGIILPNRCTLSILGYGSDELYARHISFWDDVYGIDMSNMRKEVQHEPLVEIVDPTHILTQSETVADVNMATVDLNYSNIVHNFEMKCTKSGNLSAFVGYFDTYFDLPTPVSFGTSPTDTPTHWKQVVFFIDKPHAVQADEIVRGKFTCRRLRSNARSLDIIFEVFGKTFTYYLD